MSPEEIVREVYAAVNRRDPDAVMTWFTEAAEYVNPDDAVIGGVRKGRAEIRTALAGMLETFEHYEIAVERIAQGGDVLVAVVHARARGWSSGAEVDLRAAHLWTIRSGRVERLEWTPDVDEALGRVGAAP